MKATNLVVEIYLHAYERLSTKEGVIDLDSGHLP